MINDEAGMLLAETAAENATCRRRKIGCALVSKDGELLATGYNGRPSALGSCLGDPCPDANLPAGLGAHQKVACYSIHAEQAVLLLVDPKSVHTVYSTKAPCTACTIQLLNTPCQRIVFRVNSNETVNAELWQKAGREWIHLQTQ